jgi:uncharacterized membrane protein (DUF373 family)
MSATSTLGAMMKDLLATIRRNNVYETFEHAVMFIITIAIVVIVIGGAWHLVQALVVSFIWESDGVSEHTIFQNIFGIIFTILIALEFKRSLVIVKTSAENVVRVRSIILIAMLATVRRFIVADISSVDVSGMLALAGAILSLGIVYWLVANNGAGNHDVKPPPA